MKMIAIITARGGSKRIPKKNIKEFMGKPMLAYAIDACKKSKIFETVMVSTDSEEIAGIARQEGAEVPFMRSEKTSSDFATTFDVLEEVIAEYENQGVFYDALCCVYPCVPFLTAETLCKAGMTFSGHESLIPVCKYPVPIEWAMRIDEKGLLRSNDAKAQQMRSQDIKPAYYDAGMFYFVTIEALKKYKTLYCPDNAAFIIDESECQDIDTPDDWKMAELKCRLIDDKNNTQGEER